MPKERLLCQRKKSSIFEFLGTILLRDFNAWVRRRKDHVWSYDFVSGRTHYGVPLKMPTLVDEYTGECLAPGPAPLHKSLKILLLIVMLIAQDD
jgi:hypothetical protein